MVKNISKRTKKVGLLGGALVLVGGGVAVAYWTNTGSGSGTASTGTNSPVTIVQTSTITGIAPGSGNHALSGTITNPNPGPVYVNDITVSVGSVTAADGSALPAGACEADDYLITGSPIDFNTQAAADDTTAWSGASISFVNEAAENQDGCKNAKVNLTYSSN